MKFVTVIGGGLAGCEAAWQIAERGVPVVLYEMKPRRFSPAHELPLLAELVCSNSLRSNAPDSAAGLLKNEMRHLASLIMRVADATAVPAGTALAVDRQLFAQGVTGAIEHHPLITVQREEVCRIPEPTEGPVILAAGPLLTGPLAEDLQRLTGGSHLAFYDAIAPIVDAESLDPHIVYRKSRWDDQGPGDYLNCPMNREQYERFIDLLGDAETVPLHSFEDPRYFEGCLPIEVMCQRGPDTLRFGPMKPIGLAHRSPARNPMRWCSCARKTARARPTTWSDSRPRRPMARNSGSFAPFPDWSGRFFCGWARPIATALYARRWCLSHACRCGNCRKFIAGQLSGVEGYIESTAMGLLAGIHAARLVKG
jgi:methylenetetrahydrofolate--tRNA-(uracil-5-)-methyltransferase